MYYMLIDANAHVYSPGIPVSSADCTIYAPGIVDHTPLRCRLLWRVEQIFCS